LMDLNLELQARPPPSLQNPVSQETIIP